MTIKEGFNAEFDKKCKLSRCVPLSDHWNVKMTAESDEWVPPKTSEEEAVEKARKTIIIESRRWLEVS